MVKIEMKTQQELRTYDKWYVKCDWTKKQKGTITATTKQLLLIIIISVTLTCVNSQINVR